MKTWVRPNRRAILAGAALPALVALAFGALAWWAGGSRLWLAVPAGSVCVAAACFATMILAQLLVPRITLAGNTIALYLGSRDRVALPLEVVECFFLGQGPTTVGNDSTPETESRNLVVRLAESAPEWHARDMKRSIGHWCDGYITMNGIWCEPFSEEMVRALNRKLATAKRDSKQST